jgi:GntR family transcriptional repressor for pyruvate dehydrogenase complex
VKANGLFAPASALSSGATSDREAAEVVAEHVRGLILKGELRRGEQLPPERELVKRTGVSRTSVRAGLRSLAAKGVLVTRHGAGTFVADGPPRLDSEPLSFLAALHGFTRAEMFEARRTLEVRIAGFAAERASGDELAAIADEVAHLFASVDDADAFLRHDIRFHRAVGTASGNPILASLVEMVSGLFYEFRKATASRAHDRRPSAEAHHRIYHAIRDHDRTRAEALMSDHLLEAEREQDREIELGESRPSAQPATGRP